MKAIYLSYAPPFDTINECLEGYSLDDYEEEGCICMWSSEDADSTLNCNTERTFWYHVSYGTSRAIVARSKARFATVMRDIGHTEFITDEAGRPYQYFAYMPFGEQYIEQHATNGFYCSPFRFNDSRERSTASAEGSARSAEYDEYTDQYYYGARSQRDFEHKPKGRSATLARPSPAFWRGYCNPIWSVWLGVDPLAHEYRSHSSYSFTANNPITLIDPDGRKIVWAQNPETAALEARVMALVQSNIYLRTYFNYIKNSNITINVDAGVTAQQKVRTHEKKSKDIKGAMEPNGSLLLDNYSDRTIFEEFFHAFQYCIISENLHQIVVKDGHTPSKLNHEAEVRLMLYEYNMILLKNEEIALFNNLNSNDNLDDHLRTFQKAFEPYFQIVYNGGNPSFHRDYSPAYSLKHLDGLIKQMRPSSFHKWINSDIIKLEELEKEINN